MDITVRVVPSPLASYREVNNKDAVHSVCVDAAREARDQVRAPDRGVRVSQGCSTQFAMVSRVF